MRILHTSDWHLGQNFFGLSRQFEHQQLIDWLVEVVQNKQIDAVLIAGDLYDTGAPASYARQLLSQLIAKLHACNCQLWLMAGNHDSVAVLQESQSVLQCLNTHVVTTTEHSHPQLLKNQRGEACATLVPVPFIRPRDVLNAALSGSQQALGQRISEHYHERFQQAQQHGLPVIGTGHLTLIGASTSDSERDIYIGTLEALPSSALPEFDYLAMGHIHRPQQIAGKAHWRYSGSPIALSFSEASQQKSMVLLDTEQLDQPELIELPTWQPMAYLENLTLDTLAREVDRALTQNSLWLSLSFNETRSDLTKKVHQMLADYPVQVLKVQRQQLSPTLAWQQRQASIDELTPMQVFEQRLQGIELSDEQQHALTERYQQVVTQVQEGEQ
ncbi:exonuclease subunit SbcD [Salinibius halmophilus]|uniref:exonuclease subunit SbcD n=1 Tax=Salinibius halmophilus TaxID=1853216 RepID=UPI000E661930|nr:exonuclease subunit SbcD [Salinibius halmophilus]